MDDDEALAAALALQLEFAGWREQAWAAMRRRYNFQVEYSRHRLMGWVEEQEMDQECVTDVCEKLDYLDECLRKIAAQDQLTIVYDAMESLKSSVDKLAEAAGLNNEVDSVSGQ